MPIAFNVGRSVADDERQAASEAVRAALAEVNTPKFAFVFCTDQYKAEALAAAVSAELQSTPWTGCAATGVFCGSELIEKGIVVGVLSSPQEDLNIGVGLAGPTSESPFEMGRSATLRALKSVPQQPPGYHRTIIMLCDAIKGNVAEVVRGTVREAGTNVIWAGGGAGDNLRLTHSTLFVDGHVYADHVVVVTLDTPSSMATGIRHGWNPYGPPVMVTRSHGATASALEYENAFEVYKVTAVDHGHWVTRDSFKEFAMTHPIGIPQANGEYVIRDPISINEDGSLVFIGEIPDGSIVRVMQGTQQAILNAATRAAKDARNGIQTSLGGAIIFDCVSRFVLLGKNVEHELDRFQSELGAGIPMIGCLTVGEIGSFGKSVPQFHNKTAVVLAMAG